MGKSTTEIGNEFERTVMRILYTTDPLSIARNCGGNDDGVDLRVTYLIHGTRYSVDVQCKCYTDSVTIEDINTSVDWAKAHRPSLLYFWVSSHLTNATKRYLEGFAEQYDIKVAFEEKDNIDIYISEIDNENSSILKRLRDKIFTIIEDDNDDVLYTRDRFTSYMTEECYLIDREDYKNQLIYSNNLTYYIQGVSACGKTTLIKYVTQQYYKNKFQVFWFCFSDDDIHIQTETFLKELVAYLKAIYGDYALYQYFKKYGYTITEDLVFIIITLLKKYRPVIVIDDVHKCKNSNGGLHNLFKKMIEAKFSTIFFIGWFNIFSAAVMQSNNIQSILLEGLASNHLNEIIMHNIGVSQCEIAEIIAKKYNGLPGYAMAVNESTTLDNLETDSSLIYSFVRCLSSDEQIVLFSMVLSKLALSPQVFISKDYADSFYSLLDKSVLLNKNGCYTVHDQYKKFLIDYPLSDYTLDAIAEILQKVAETNTSTILDIVNIYIMQHKIQAAYDLLNANFENLIHKQLYSQMLSIYIRFEKLSDSIDKSNLIPFYKIMIFERMEKYDICLNYIKLFQGVLVDTNDVTEMLTYIHMRCLYFTNQYDQVIELFNKKKKIITDSNNHDVQTQIYLIIGRVFYIRGYLEGALQFYILSFLTSYKNNKRLAVKSIHRIAMIETDLRLVQESKVTFETILDTDLITPKRKSYVYYRIARCNFLQGDYEQASKNNEESVKIKKSFNHIRGLIFSNRLSAKIALLRNTTFVAIGLLQEASDLALNLGLSKEWVSVVIEELRYNKIQSDSLSETQIGNFTKCIDIIKKEKLLSRLKKIKKIQQDYPELSYLDIDLEIEDMESIIRSDFERCRADMDFSDEILSSLFNSLLVDRQSITEKLLVWVGLGNA